MEVELFVPCFVDQLFPDTAFNAIRLLEKSGCHVLYNPQQTCCGLPAYQAGFWEEAEAIGRKFLTDFSTNHVIVSLSTSCTGMVRSGFKDLFDSRTEQVHCQKIQQNVVEISDFLVNVLHKDYFGAELEGIAVYYDSDQTLQEYKIKDGPRRLLTKVLGLEILETVDTPYYYGFDDPFAVNTEGMSTAIAKQKVREAMEVNADFIVSTDPTYLMQFQAYIDKHKLPLQTMHLVDVLTTGWGNI